MIFATTTSTVEGYQIVGYRGTVQGTTFEDLLNNTEALGANAVLNVCYDNALSTDTLFQGSAVVIEPAPIPEYRRLGEQHSSFIPTPHTEANGETR